MNLYINTLDRKKITVGLRQAGEPVDSLEDENQFGSQVLLSLIEKILKKNKLKFGDLDGIEVETGPGSYTGIKVGVSVANALGFSLGLKINGKKTEADLNY